MSKINTIITGHGHFATGMKSSLELLSGKHKHLHYVDFEETMSEIDLGKLLNNLIEVNKENLFFCDLVGGTPFKESAKISFQNDKARVVAGCNIASLLESVFKDYDSVDDYADDLIKISKNATQKLDLSDDENIQDDNEEDGI